MTAKNFAVTTVAVAPSPAASGTSLVVAAGSASRFPSVPFQAVIWPALVAPTPDNAEVVQVTARATDTLTITRAQESSTARAVVIGDRIAATQTAAMFDALADTVLSVTDPRFGAVGDGVTDDTDAIQRALNAAKAIADVEGGATVAIPPGVYVVNQTVTVPATGDVVGTPLQLFSHTTVLGLGGTLKKPAGYTIPTILAGYYQAQGWAVEGVRFDGNVDAAGSVGSGYTLSIPTGATDFRIENNRFRDCWGAPIGSSNVAGTTISSFRIHGNELIRSEHGTGMFISQASDFTISDNIISDTYDDGIALISLRTDEATTNTGYCRDGVIANNQLTNTAKATGSAIVITGERITCTGNTIRSTELADPTPGDSGVGAIRIMPSLPDLVGGAGGHAEKSGLCFTTAASTTVTAGSSLFVPADVGKTIYVPGAGASGGFLRTRIAAYVSATQITVVTAAATAVSNALGQVGRGEWAAVDVVCANNTITNAGSIGISGVAARSTIAGNRISTTRYAGGIWFFRSETTTFPAQPGDLVIENNAVTSCAKEGIKVGPSPNLATIGPMPSCIVRGNAVVAAGETGVALVPSVGTPLLLVERNVARSCVGMGIDLNGAATLLVLRENLSLSNGGIGIRISPTADFTKAWRRSNRSYGNTGLNWSTSTNSIDDFIPVLTEASPEWSDPNSDNIGILDISSHDVYKVTFGSAKTIDNFAAAEPGVAKILQFTNANATIPDANVRMAAAFTSTSNDVIMVIFDGTNWYQIAPAALV